MQKVIKAHPAVVEYDRVHASYVRASFSDNWDWWCHYREQRTLQIANNYKLTTPELINMWVDWLNETNQTR